MTDTDLDDLLDTATGLASGLRAGAVMEELERLRTRHRHRAGFRLALLGEQAVRTDLINDLVGRQVIPTLAGLGRMRVIVADPDDTLGLDGPDGGIHLPLSSSAWRTVDRSGLRGPVRLAVNSAELRGLGTEIVDIPARGTDVPDDPWIRAAIAGSDLAVMIVAAASQLTWNEAGLLRTVTCRVHVPHVAVLITALDRVEPAEQADAVAEIERKARRAATGVRVITADAAGSGAAELAALTARLAIDAGRNGRRGQQVRTQLLAAAHELAEIDARRAGIARLRGAARERAVIARRRELDTADETWNALRAGFDERRIATVGRLAPLATSRREQVLAQLRAALPGDADLDRLRHELRFRLRNCLVDVAAELDGLIATRLADDVAWLGAALRGEAGYLAPMPVRIAVGVPELAPVAIDDPDHLSWMLRISAVASPMLAPLLQSMTGVPVPDLGMLADTAAEKRMRRRTGDRAVLLDARLSEAVHRGFGALVADATARVGHAYHGVALQAELRLRQIAAERVAELQGPPGEQQPGWAAELGALIAELNRA